MSSNENKNNETENTSNTLSYIKAVCFITVQVVITVAIGSMIMYSCKVAQANIIPTDVGCSPFVNNPPSIKEIKINNNVTNVEGELLSQKISFPYEINKKNMFFDFLRRYKEKPSSSSLANYFITIIEAIAVFDFTAYNMFYNTMNDAPELFVIFFGPIITFLYSILIHIISLAYICYLWFSKMSWFFKENTNKTDKGSPHWKSISVLQPIQYGIALLLVFLFFLLFWLSLFTIFPALTFMIMLFCFGSILGMTAINEKNQKYSFLNCIKDIFKFKKDMIMTILSFFVIAASFNYMGIQAGAMAMVTLILVYFNIIPIQVFSVKKPDFLSELVSYHQAAKKCNPLPETIYHPGFIERLLFPQKGGGGEEDILKKIKKICATLKKE